MIEVLIGILLGLLSGTVTESVGHKFFGHPSAWQLKLYFKYPRLFAPVLRAYYHHGVIHHEKTYQKDILTQFESADEKQKIDTWIESKFDRDFAELIWAERYNLTLKGVQGTLPFALPFTFGPLLIGALFGPVAFLASLIPAYLPVALSKFLHPLVHAPEDLIDSPAVLRALAKTPYMKAMLKNHYLHHLHPEANFNLMLGGDYIVGVHRKASQAEEADFASIWTRYESSWDSGVEKRQLLPAKKRSV